MTDQDRKPRFILVDPSAVHTGGHHYEYAARILNLAAARGFEPELWANRKSELPEDAFPVKRLLHKTFYQNFSRLGGGRIINLLRHQGLRGLIAAFYRKASTHALRFFLEHPLGIHASRAYHDAVSGNKYRLIYSGPQNRIRTGPFWYSLFYLVFKIGRFLKHHHNRRPVRAVIWIVAILAALLALPFALLGLVVFGGLFAWRLRGKPADTLLAEDLAQGLQSTRDWQGGDIVFIPTCFTTEIKAMPQLFEMMRDVETLPQFHLLFRTNVFTGTEDTHHHQAESALDYRLAFKWLRQNHDKRIVRYFTDTPQLARQYKILSDEEFGVLPVPVPWASPVESPQAGPLNIIYVGDVRDEKGYQFYPEIIEALWDDYIATGRAKFTLQSNYADNPDVCRESAISQSLLRGYADEHVTHVKGPMASTQYREFVESADIVLITYKPEHYMARSSGIFIEAMKAGKPALMPATTWMADELETQRQAKWRAAVEGRKAVAGQSNMDIHKRIPLPKGKAVAYVVTASFATAHDHTGFIEAFIETANGQVIASDIAQMDAGGNVCVRVFLPEAQNADLYLRYALVGKRGAVQKLEVYAFDADVPALQDFACAVYARQNVAAMASRLKHLIDHYDSYKAEVLSWRGARSAYFTPETLVDGLIAASGDAL